MSEVRMISPVVKNVPWQEKPAGLKGALNRLSSSEYTSYQSTATLQHTA